MATTVALRELKNRMGSYMDRVRGGEMLVVTDRGRTIARIVPVEEEDPDAAIWAAVARGDLHWSGGKPRGATTEIVLEGEPMADAVIEGRGPR